MLSLSLCLCRSFSYSSFSIKGTEQGGEGVFQFELYSIYRSFSRLSGVMTRQSIMTGPVSRHAYVHA
jgi:hypothetical protein